MSFQDKSIQCSDCGAAFTFTADDQEYFRSKGYINPPKRCPECRQTRKAERTGSSGFVVPRQMFPAICSECGKSTQVPFQPRGDKPVYCSDCYRKVKPTR